MKFVLLHICSLLNISLKYMKQLPYYNILLSDYYQGTINNKILKKSLVRPPYHMPDLVRRFIQVWPGVMRNLDLTVANNMGLKSESIFFSILDLVLYSPSRFKAAESEDVTLRISSPTFQLTKLVNIKTSSFACVPVTSSMPWTPNIC